MGRTEDMKTSHPVSAPPSTPRAPAARAHEAAEAAGRCRPPSVGDGAETKPGQPDAQRWGRLGSQGRAAGLGSWTGRMRREGRAAGLISRPSAWD